MTTATMDRDVRSRAYDSIGFGNVVRSEWTKLRSLRSTAVCGGLTILIVVGLAITLGARWAHQHGPLPPNFDATNMSLSGIYLAQVVVGTLAVMMISSEYATGMIRATFTAVPQRRSVLAAKALVVATVTLIVGEIVSFAAFAIGQAFFAHKQAGVSLSDPGVLRAVSGAGLYLVVVALLGFGLGAVFRHTAAALSAFFGLLFALDLVTELLPDSWRSTIIDYLPLNAGSEVFMVVNVKGGLSPWTGLGVFACYAAAALAAGFLLVEVRDT